MNALSKPGKVNLAALIAAAVGILILFASIPDEFPKVPPGPIILLVAAGLVAFAPGRRTPLIGVIVPLFIFVGGLVSGTPGLLLHPDNVGAFVGVVTQMIALVIAITAGTITQLGNQATPEVTP